MLRKAVQYTPVSVNSAKKFRLQIHVIKANPLYQSCCLEFSDKKDVLLVDDLVPIGLDLIFGNILKRFFTETEQYQDGAPWNSEMSTDADMNRL